MNSKQLQAGITSSHGRRRSIATRITSTIGAALLFTATSVTAAPVFDSIAEFSSTQGASGWFYGYYTTPAVASTFTQMTNFIGGTTWAESPTQPPWTLLWANGGHPNGANNGAEHWAVRRWVSDVSGIINVSGAHQMAASGQTQVSIWLNGISAYQALPPASSGTSATFSLPLAVTVGSTVDFAISPFGEDISDSTIFHAAAAAIPEPSTYVLMIAGLGFVGFIASRRRKAQATA